MIDHEGISEQRRLAFGGFTWVQALVLLGITVAGGLLRFWHLGAQSLWEDEVVTTNLLHEHLWTMLRFGIPQRENTPPLFYVVGWVWVRVFGTAADTQRSLSAVVGTATIPVAYLAARTLAGVRAGLIAATLVAFSPILVWYSQESRVYSLFAFVSALSFLFFARTVSSDRSRDLAGRDLAGWVVCSILALTTHYFAAFLVAVQAVWLTYRIRRTRPLVFAFAPLAAVTVALLPLIQKQRSTGTADFIAGTKLTTRLEQFAAWFTTGDLQNNGALVVAGLLIASGIALLLNRRHCPGSSGALTGLGVGLGTITLPLVLVAVGLDYFFFRNLILAWVPLAIAVAAGFASTRLGQAAAAGLCVVFLIADIAVVRQANLQRDDWRSVAAIVTTNDGPTMLAVYPAWDFEPLDYYAPNLTEPGKHPVRVQSLWFVGDSSRFSGWKAPLSLTLRIPTGFRLVSTRIFQHFLLRHYLAQKPEPINQTQIRQLVISANGKNIPHVQALLQR